MDETWVNQNHCTDYMSLSNDGSDAPKIPSGKGKRLIVLHAGTREQASTDFQTTQERQHYSSPDDSHHPLIWPETPKKVLYEKIEQKKTPVGYKTDKIADLHGHEVLRNPVRHCELNPIELIWAQVKGFVAKNKLGFFRAGIN
jgi:hypothetical protein